MCNARFQECPLCGGSAVLELRLDLIRSVSGTVHMEIDPSSPSFVSRGLHAASLLMFGGRRYSCCECGEMFSSGRQSNYGSSDGSGIAELEVNLLID